MTAEQLEQLWADAKARIKTENDAKQSVRTQALEVGVPWPKSERSEAVSEEVAFAGVRAANDGVTQAETALTHAKTTLEHAQATFGATVDEKLALIRSETRYWQGGLETSSVPVSPPAPTPQPVAPKLSLKTGKRTFKGKAAELARLLDAHLSQGDQVVQNIRHVPKGWDPSQLWPKEHTNPRGRKLNFGANPVQRGVWSGYGMVNYFHLMLTGDVRCLDIALQHLKLGLAGLIVQGGVNTTETDAWLGIPYGTSDGAGTTAANTYTNLEAMLLGGAGAHAHSAWENPTPERLQLVNEYRAFFWLHHVPRWVSEFGAEWSAKEPTYERKNFAHSNLNAGGNAVLIAEIETGMFRAGMTKPVTVDLPDGFDGKTKRKTKAFVSEGGKIRWFEGDGRTVSLAPGTSADKRTHPLYKQACAIFKQFVNPVTFRIVYGDDIKDPEMRRLYGKTGCAVWDQRTNRPGFTANSGYNQMTYAALEVLKQQGVIADVLGGTDKADAFMAAIAGGVSVGLLPERFVKDGKTSYVQDDPDTERVSHAYLVNGRDVRAFGGGTKGNETDDSPEWCAELYALPAYADPADLIAPKSERLLEHAVKVWDKDREGFAGDAVARLYNEVVRGRA